MAVEEGLFGKYKQCEFCGRPLPKNYELSLQPSCKQAASSSHLILPNTAPFAFTKAPFATPGC